MSDSKNIVNFPDHGTIEAEAALWVVRLENDKMSADSYAEFQAWQRRSPAHREALSRLTTLWSDFDVLENLAPPLPETSAAAPGSRPEWRAFPTAHRD